MYWQYVVLQYFCDDTYHGTRVRMYHGTCARCGSRYSRVGCCGEAAALLCLTLGPDVRAVSGGELHVFKLRGDQSVQSAVGDVVVPVVCLLCRRGSRARVLQARGRDDAWLEEARVGTWMAAGKP